MQEPHLASLFGDQRRAAIPQPITYGLAFGLNKGKKVLGLQAVPTSDNLAKTSELVSKFISRIQFVSSSKTTRFLSRTEANLIFQRDHVLGG